ncbi:MAG: Lrp/AsnC family transcriptional regulator [Candidatus Aenigmarchaeota archaeon]|nr:Lrp/AsnC family transcriptional regulator [Candidatus Aenigmarchaeota archaeon]
MTEVKPGKYVELDVKDRRILYELSKNARFSLTNVAKRVGLSREVVTYRLEVLAKKGILTGFTTIVDVKRLGKLKHIVYLQLQHFDKEWEGQFIEKLVKDRDIIWIATCGGKWDVGLLIASNSLQEFDRTLGNITSLCGAYLNDYMILSEVRESYLGLGLLMEGMPPSKGYYIRDTASFQKELESPKPDMAVFTKKDLGILKMLVQDARIRIIDIAKSLGVSQQFVKSRIKALIRTGVIAGFMPMVSFYMQGYQWNMAFLRFANITEQEEARLVAYLKKHPNMLWYVKTLGRWNMELSIFSRDSSHYKEILNSLRTEFSGAIKDYESVMIFNQYKYFHSLE